MDYIIRTLKTEEIPLLNDFLYEAIFVPNGTAPPSREIIKHPDLQIYVSEFGAKFGDYALVAEVNHQVIGAVWVRIMHDYGHVDDQTPSVSISLHKSYRGHGIGTDLMEKMLQLLKENGFKQVSLSVQKANAAVRMYEHLGFRTIIENKEDYIMVCQL